MIETRNGDHSVFARFPKHPNCEVCNKDHMRQSRPLRRADGLPHLLPHSEAQISCKPISSNDEARLHQLGKKMLRGIFMVFVLRAGGRTVERFAYRGLRRLRELASLRYPLQKSSSTWKSHKKESIGVQVPTDLLKPHAAKCPTRETLSKMQK